VEYAGWRAPAAEPLHVAGIERYRLLKEQDKRYAERMSRLSQSLGLWLAVGALLFLGMAVAGVLDIALPRSLVTKGSAVAGLLAFASVPVAWQAGKGDGWAPLVYAIVAIVAASIFAFGLTIGNLLLTKRATDH
jgi:hypothetical protein